jgi:hypothetical protein
VVGVLRSHARDGEGSETQEELTLGWRNAAIISSAKNIGRRPAFLSQRCKTEIALANALDAERMWIGGAVNSSRGHVERARHGRRGDSSPSTDLSYGSWTAVGHNAPMLHASALPQ